MAGERGGTTKGGAGQTQEARKASSRGDGVAVVLSVPCLSLPDIRVEDISEPLNRRGRVESSSRAD